MANDYTQFDWAADRLSRQIWAAEEERLMTEIDRRASKRAKKSKLNKKNHREYA